MCGHTVVKAKERQIRTLKLDFLTYICKVPLILEARPCHTVFVFNKTGLQPPRQCSVLCSWVTNTMTNHQVPLLLIYFNWCVIYAAVRLEFALLSINKPHSKSQRALKRNANKARCALHCSFMVDQLNVPPAER